MKYILELILQNTSRQGKVHENNLNLVFLLLEILHKNLETNAVELILTIKVNTAKIIDSFEGFRLH